MKVVIVEDEVHSAEKLERMFLEVEPEGEVLARLESVKEATQWLKKNTADLLFLDIHLSDGNSFQIFEKCPVKVPIIFTTAYDQYAIKAFKVNSLDYLLKPIHRKDLTLAMDKFHEWHQQTSSTDNMDFQAIMEAERGPKADYQKRFMVHSGEKIRSIPVEDVAYFLSEGKYAFLVTRSGPQYLIDSSLDRVQLGLDPSQFFRINRQFIIHIDAIANMVSYTKGRVKLELEPPANRDTIVSVERSPDFKRWLNQ
ncbi:MAG: LytR/AlgR family response regulator transcription factor [Salibacteraceae bacterium]